MAFLSWLAALALIASGVWVLLRGAVLYGVLLIVAGLLVGPGGLGALA
jgi:hypothetical protein